MKTIKLWAYLKAQQIISSLCLRNWPNSKIIFLIRVYLRFLGKFSWFLCLINCFIVFYISSNCRTFHQYSQLAWHCPFNKGFYTKETNLPPIGRRLRYIFMSLLKKCFLFKKKGVSDSSLPASWAYPVIPSIFMGFSS